MREELYSEGYGSSFFVWGRDGNSRQISPLAFPYPSNKESSRLAGPSLSQRFGRFAYTLSALNGHCSFLRGDVDGDGAMSVHIRQCVREQPDTGYWKSERTYLAAVPWFL